MCKYLISTTLLIGILGSVIAQNKPVIPIPNPAQIQWQNTALLNYVINRKENSIRNIDTTTLSIIWKTKNNEFKNNTYFFYNLFNDA